MYIFHIFQIRLQQREETKQINIYIHIYIYTRKFQMFVRRPMLYIFDACIWNFEALGFGKDGYTENRWIKNENEVITNNLICFVP